ncbi:T9SS type A sorting domain-containing protein [Hymenobacter sp. BT664]|uniref:T9SS type A sorting domain-containing protein n=1 Tax=Hymenobacter montanus TaxID=2771359 RepID=A0A927BFJ5_9BACT|nr:T9SS type A sorting domain-containing protein [Hymenobacter montanus]MBD2769942.1 T9SS type A sorting domain-containing protein [Hymenobacter montanus]
MLQNLLSRNTPYLPVVDRSAQRCRWQPLVAAAFGLLALTPGAYAQHLTLPPPMAERIVVPAAAVAAPLVTAAPAALIMAHRGLASISSTATGGNWSDPTTWVGGVVPTSSDDVTIAAGATVTLDQAGSCSSLTVASTGSLLTSATTSYSLQVAGSVLNNGTLDLSASASIGSGLRFTGAGNASFAGTGTTDLHALSLAKSVRADIVEMNLPSISVKGSSASGDGFLFTRTTGATPADDMTGTLRISGTAPITNQVFGNGAAYVIPATGGLWLNNARFTVVGQNGSASVNGLLRISAGTYNVGTASGNSLSFGSGALFTMEGGTLNGAGRITSYTSATATTSITFSMSGGTINVSTVGNASAAPSFGFSGTSTMSGGTINLVQRSTAATPLDYNMNATSSFFFTGGTLNVGTGATTTNFDFRIRGNVPNLTIDNTTSNKSVLLTAQINCYGTVLVPVGTTLNLNGFSLLVAGATVTNNGTLAGTTVSSTLYFAGATAQTLVGTGTFTTVRSLTIDNAAGVTLTVPLVVTRLNMFTGNLNGVNNLTIGDGSTLLFTIQIGVGNNPGSSGSITSAPTFNLGTGALQLLYAPETTARTTGFEIPPTRVVDAITVNNPAGVILAGGNLTLNASGVTNGSLTLTAGILTTSATNKLTIGTAAATIPPGLANSYVKGPLGITVNSTTAVSRTFAVGDAGGWRPVVVTGITTSTPQVFTVTVVNGPTGGTPVLPLTTLNPTRYVRLENSVALPATARVQLSYGAGEISNATTAVVAQAATAAGTYVSLGRAAFTAPTTGLASTLNLTPGNDFFVLANNEGGVLSTSVTSVCGGTNSGTLTLTGNASGSTITGYEADAGSGFVAVPGSNTTATLAFTNLLATTTFRAVILTTDNRTVYSTPITVTVNSIPTATLTATTPVSFCGSGTLTLTATPVAGATYQYQLNGSNIAGATSASYTTTVTASGSYSVVVTSAASCSATSAPVAVTVNPSTTATFAYSGASFCQGGTNPTPTITGTAGGTFSSTAGLSLNTSTGTIDLIASTPGTYTITYSVAGACPSSATAVVTITSLPVATFSYASTAYCTSGSNPAPVIPATSTAGTFSSTAGLTINAATGVITLASSTPGTYVVTNTVGAAGGCPAITATFSVTITSPPVATFSYASAAYCTSGSNPAPVIPAPSTAGTFSSTAGLTINATTGVITLASSTPGTYVVTNTVGAAGGCAAATATFSVTITSPQAATFSYASTAYCTSGTNPAPVIPAPSTAGTFSSTAGLIINATTGVITLASSTPGTYVVTNTVGASGGCPAATATFSVTITRPLVATFSYASAAYCTSGTNPAPVIPALSTAGTFSSTAGLTINATTGVITLASSTPGTYVVTNTVGASGGCAGATATFSVTITSPQVATFSYASAAYCTSGTNPAPVIPAPSTAGTFSSTAGLTINPTTGVITLASSTPGTYVVTNTVGAAGGCAAVTATFSVTITRPPVATFSYASAAYCTSGTNPAPVIPAPSTAGTFSSTVGLTINATTGVITLGSSTPGTYVVTNTVGAAGGCAAVTATFSVTINPVPATPTISVAYNGPTVRLTSSAASGNQWFLNGVAVAGATNQVYVVNSAAQFGGYTVTTTNASGCTSAPSAPLVVSSSVKPLAGSSLNVYPNPTHDGKLHVELTGYRKAVELTLFNALGQPVQTRTVPASAGSTTTTLDLTPLPTGVYILRTRTEGGLDTRRIVKQ